MLTELCGYLKNWFDRNRAKYIGHITIKNGVILQIYGQIQMNQFFRIIGSVFNDGVHKYGDPEDVLTDETFDGAVWLMAVPKEVIQLAKDIEDWQAKYGGLDSAAMSPFNSESFGGYSYSKSGGGSSDGTNTAGTWQAAFASRLSRWRKI